jgi:hypothetical protein
LGKTLLLLFCLDGLACPVEGYWEANHNANFIKNGKRITLERTLTHKEFEKLGLLVSKYLWGIESKYIRRVNVNGKQLIAILSDESKKKIDLELPEGYKLCQPERKYYRNIGIQKYWRNKT